MSSEQLHDDSDFKVRNADRRHELAKRALGLERIQFLVAETVDFGIGEETSESGVSAQASGSGYVHSFELGGGKKFQRFAKRRQARGAR